MPIANHDSIIQLLVLLPLLAELPRRHRPPPAGLPPDSDHLCLEPDEPVKVEPLREVLEVPEHLLVAGEPARVDDGAACRGEGEVEEAHDLAGEVGAERSVEAGVGGGGAERVGSGCGGGGGVEPGAPHGGGALEDDGGVALAAELSCRRQAGRARAYDGEAERGRRHGRADEEERLRRAVPGFFRQGAVRDSVSVGFVRVGIGDLEGSGVFYASPTVLAAFWNVRVLREIPQKKR